MATHAQDSGLQPTHAGPTCPFCQAAWSQAMLDHYDRLSAGSSCGCGHDHGSGHQNIMDHAPVAPVGDLCCTSCGRAIYRAPSQA
jgi:hypothetical protein